MGREPMGKVLYRDIADKIETAIMRGEWASGQKLPPLAELARHFSVSKAVMREACSLLVGAGLLEIRHGDGVYVQQLTLDTILRPLQAALLLGQSDLRALLEVGLWMERGIAVAAAKRRTEEDCAKLVEALFHMDSGRGNIDIVLEGERMFHVALADAAENAMASNLLRILYHPLSSVMALLIADAQLEELILTVHRALYDSIEGMDGEAASRQIELYRSALQDRVYDLRKKIEWSPDASQSVKGDFS